jgi:hypothetical protein
LPVLVLLALGALFASRRAERPAPLAAAAAALALAAWAAGWPGPVPVLALCLAAALGVATWRKAWGFAGRVPSAIALAALAAAPVLARNDGADWAALAAPVCVLLLLGRLSRRLGVWPALALAAGPWVALAAWLGGRFA